MAFFAPVPDTPEVPIIGVCEALQNLPKYNGTLVIVVGFVGFTFEGSFMDQQCATGDMTVIAGEKWLSMIAIGSAERDRTAAIRWEVDALKQKLKQVQLKTKAPTSSGSSFDGRWVANYGRLETPRDLRPPSGSKATFRAGNGYGANGSVLRD